MRTRHRSAAPRLVSVARQGGEDIAAWRGDVYPRAILREVGQAVVGVARGDCQRVLVEGGVEGRVAAVVARRRHDHTAAIPRIVHCVRKLLRARRAAQTQAQHMRAVVRCPSDAPRHIAHRAEALIVQHLDRHHLHRRSTRDACNPDAVARVRGGDARAVRAVPVKIVRVRVVQLRVVAVYCTVAIAAHALGQVGMVGVHARVDNRDVDSALRGGDCPTLATA
jgi:hypothetical protein